jgi:hypothetical protein
MEQVGLDAVPLVALLCFLVGAVVAFLGSNILRDFGATIYVVELVSIAFLREFGVLLTAIILAGRTASAFTAQIGAMKSREEVDAIRTLGMDPIDLLVIPARAGAAGDAAAADLRREWSSACSAVSPWAPTAWTFRRCSTSRACTTRWSCAISSSAWSRRRSSPW